MFSFEQLIAAFFISLATAVLVTPLIKKLAFRIGAIDYPNERKIHVRRMPRLGGLAIVIGTAAGYLYLRPDSDYLTAIVIGAAIIVLVGILDDKFSLSPLWKLIGQLCAAIVVVSSGLTIDFITMPFGGEIEFGWMAYFVTVFWIIAITNAINLIDGLDGLASGVSTIAISTLLIMAILDHQLLVITLSTILAGSTIGFLLFNFHPAKIFMGDTGALFLGYSISILSILGLFKSVTLFSFVIPIIVLAVPIFDTLFAIIRRVLNKQKISAPDKYHLHHCLLSMGFSHRTTVIIIYGISLFFGGSAILFSKATLWGSLLIIALLLMIVQLTAEVTGLIGKKRKPVLNIIKRFKLLNQQHKNG